MLAPEEDNAGFIRFLHPFLSQTITPESTSSEQLMSMNQTLCVLSTISSLSLHATALDIVLAKDMWIGLYRLLTTSRKWEIINLVCRSICCLATKDPGVKDSLCSMSVLFYTHLQENLRIVRRSKAEEEAKCEWFIFVLGKLCK